MLTDLRYSGRTVSSVAFEAGFGDISYFIAPSAVFTAQRHRTCAQGAAVAAN